MMCGPYICNVLKQLMVDKGYMTQDDRLSMTEDELMEIFPEWGIQKPEKSLNTILDGDAWWFTDKEGNAQRKQALENAIMEVCKIFVGTTKQ